ncbi:putative efflux transporter [Cyathus striatus]|nr:putative efflux transporter [Cyathus striatus]
MRSVSPNMSSQSWVSTRDTSSTGKSVSNGLDGSVGFERETRRSTARSLLLVFTATFAMIVNIANTTAVATALPTIGRELQAEEAQLQWLVSAYSLSSGCLLVAFGRLADLHGRRKAFLLGSLWLLAFTIGCGFTNDITTLNILRGLQGVGASATIPAALGILADAFPPSPSRSLAFATFAAGAPIGAVFGNVLGAVLTEYTAKSWRSAFYFLSGLDFICIAGAILSFDKDIPSDENDKRVDWIGAFLVTTGLVLIVFVLGQGEVAPKQWRTPYIIALLIVGVLFIRQLERLLNNQNAGRNNSSWLHSLTTSPPLMKLSLWSRADGKLAATMAVAFLNWCAFMGWLFWVQLYYQNYKQYTAIKTVIRLLPMFVSGLVCTSFVGIMASRVPYVILMVTGTLGASVACVLFSLIDENATYWAFGLPATAISVIGADFVFAGGTLFIAKASLPHEQSVAGALFQTMIQVGTAVGITVSTVVFNRVTKHNGGKISLESYRVAQWTCFAFGCIAMILAALSFGGVGVVGQRKQKHSDMEKIPSDHCANVDGEN